jgi:chromosome segregation ATPase/CheY-like chemotaxis protein
MGQRLLIVDSDRTFLAEQRVTLESAFEVEILANPDSESLMGRVESGDIAAVLICVEVSENKGYAYCTNLRKLQAQKPPLAGIKVALISSKATEEEYKRHQSLKGRADLYLHKPIPPAALVAALSQLVPPRPVDPHNPLGDLADADDLFSDLKNLEVDHLFEKSAPAAPSAVTQQLDPVKTAPPRTTQSDLMQAQMEGLLQELRAREQELVAARAEAQAARAELQAAQRAMNSVTRNLEDLEARERESAKLQAQLAEAQAALSKVEGSSADLDALKAQLRATLEEKHEHLQQIEELNQQVADKTQKAIELLRERDRLQGQVLELEPFRAQAEQALADLGTARTEAQAAKARLEAMEEMLQRLPTVEKELAKAKGEAAQLETSLLGLTEKHQALETERGKLQADLAATKDELAAQEAQVAAAKRELSGLEATMRGQGRELAELQERIQQMDARATRAEAQAQDLADKLKVKDENLEKMGNEIFSISAQRNELQTRLEDAMHTRETERMELMAGLDAKESELHQLQERLQQLERDKQALEGQLAERGDRLAGLHTLLGELSERLRKGADLAQG